MAVDDSAENLNLMQDNAENAINEVSAILENKQDKWQTIWEGSATTGNTISTGVDFTNIKGIRFKDNKSNCWHEATNKMEYYINRYKFKCIEMV